jgi:hypothetical protein
MNWSKGFFRLWIGLSVLWIIAASFWLVPVAQNYFEARSGLQLMVMEASRIPLKEDKSKTLTPEAAEKIRHTIKVLEMVVARGDKLTEREQLALFKGKRAIREAQIQAIGKARAVLELRKLRKEFLSGAAVIAFLPICTLLFGFLVRWIWRGFSYRKGT